MKAHFAFLGTAILLTLLLASCRSTPSTVDPGAEAKSLVKYHLMNKQYAEAKDGLIKLIEKGQADPQDYAQLSELHLSQGEADKGESVLKDGVMRFPQNAFLLMRLGSYVAALKRYSDAVPLLQKAADLDPKDPTTLMNLCTVQMRLGDKAGAAATAAKLYKLVPGPSEGILYAGELEESGNTAEAEKVYREVVAKAPDNALALNNLAAILTDRNDLTEAENIARSASRKVPDNGRVLDTLGWVLFRQQHSDQALEVLDRAAKLEPNSGTIQYHRGVALSSINKNVESREALAEALRLDDGAVWAKDAQNRLDQLKVR
jgi:Flp pilus assembly protein TadD